MNQPRAAQGELAIRDLRCACASARRMARLLTSVYDRGLREAGIDAPQFAMLATIGHEGPCTQTALGRRHALDKSTASRNLTVLHKSGWIAFSATDDGRERRVTLTPAGARQVARAESAWQRAQDSVRRGMTATQWTAMFGTFRAVSHAARAAQASEAKKAKLANAPGSKSKSAAT